MIAQRTHRLISTDTLASGVALLLTFTLLQRVVGFGRGILLCRWLDAEQLGQWDMAFSFLLLASPVVILSLPSAFGRYLEHYRQRGQLRTFIRRTAVFALSATCIAGVAMALYLPAFSRLIFGSQQQTRLVAVLIVALAGTIAYGFVTNLFTALRMQRISSTLHMLNSLLFAGLSVALLLVWQADAMSVIVAYGSACLVTFAVSFVWLARVDSGTSAAPAAAQRPFWLKIMPFVLSVWMTDWLSNLFAIADRYMIVHTSGLEPAAALSLVGEYHTARFVPLVFVQICGMLACVFMPYQTRDWENGRRDVAVARLNLLLKVLGIVLLGGGVVVLFASPLLFDILFSGKFALGKSILPWTLVFCSWMALTFTARTYLWCAQRPGLVALSLLGGLVINVALNAILLPSFGLFGAVWATSAGTFTALLLVYAFSRGMGMQVHSGTYFVSALPAVCCLGPWVALGVLATVLAISLRTNWLLLPGEKQHLAAAVRQYGAHIRSLFTRHRAASAHSAPSSPSATGVASYNCL